MIDEFLISFLNSDPTIASLADEIAVGQVPEDEDGNLLVETYIWVSTYDEADELDLDGTSGITRYRFDLEACSTDDRKAKQMARQVKKLLQGYGPGDFGEITLEDDSVVTGYVDAVYVESKDEDYIATNQFTNDAVSVVAFDLEIVADDSQDDNQGA